MLGMNGATPQNEMRPMAASAPDVPLSQKYTRPSSTMKTMLIRRAMRMKPRTSGPLVAGTIEKRSASGMTMWLEIMVERAIDETMTIDVAEENPPRKASSAIQSWSAVRGRVRRSEEHTSELQSIMR